VTTDFGAPRRYRKKLHVLRDGDHLTVYAEDGSVRWAGVIDFEYESNWTEYPSRPASGIGHQAIAAGWWAHGLQRGSAPEEWADLFWGHEIALQGARTTPRRSPLRATLLRRVGA
jgi:hypothetical protein